MHTVDGELQVLSAVPHRGREAESERAQLAELYQGTNRSLLVTVDTLAFTYQLSYLGVQSERLSFQEQYLPT